jgi:outer membrane protein OmpA-like peptidoglycan-associated protein
MKKVILALTTVFCLQAQAQKADALIDEYITDRLTLQVSIGNNFDLYQPLNDANLVLIPIRDFRSFYSDYDVFAWNLEGQMSVALNPVWSLYAGASMGTMSGSNNTDYYRADMLSGDIGLKFNIANMRINRKRSRLTLVPLAGLSYNYFNSELFYLSDVTPQHSESGFAPGLNVGAELDFSLTKNIAVYGSMVRRGFQHDGLDGWDYGGNGDNYLRTNVGVKIKLTKTLESEHATDINIWDLASNNSTNIINKAPQEKDILEFKYWMNNYVVGDKEDYENGRKLNPTLYVVRGLTYNIKNTAEDHPLRLSKKPKRRKNPAGLSKNGIRPDHGIVTWKIPMDAPEEYYYYSDMTDSIGGVIKVLSPSEASTKNKKVVNNEGDTTLNIAVAPVAEPKDDFAFDVGKDHISVGDPDEYEDGNNEDPVIYVVRGGTYRLKNDSDKNPLRIGKSPGDKTDPKGLEKNGITDDDGTVEWKVPLDAPGEYYYYSGDDDEVGGVIKVLGPGEPQQADNRDLYATINHILFELDKLRQREEQVFDFDVTDDHVTVGDESDYEDGNNEEPTIYVVRGQTYKMKNKADDKPLRFSKSPDSQEDPKGLEDNGITQEDGTVEWSIPLDAPEEYYYYSEGDDEVGGVIKVLGPGEAPESTDDEILDEIEDLKEEVERLKAMALQAPGDTSVTITTVQSVESSHVYEFDVTDDHVTVGDKDDYENGDNKEPIIYVVRGESYTMKNKADDKPLRFSKSPDRQENPKGLEENGITEEDGTVEWVIPLDAPEEYYYYSEEDDDKVGGIIKVLGPNDDWKDYIDDEISKLEAQIAEGSRDTAVSITNVQMVAPAADDFIFQDQDSVYTIGENGDYEEGNNQNPTIYVMRGQTYSFRNNSEDHPLRVSRKEAQRDDPRGLEKNAITKEDESISWKIPHDAPDEYYYYSEANDTLRGVIKVVGQGGGDTYDVDMSQDFNKIVNDLQTRMEEELTNLKSADDIERFEGGHHLVLFYDVDIHILTRDQKKKIFEFVYKLKKESDGYEYKLIISGFADVRASAAYNDALRQRRSNEVKKFLKQLGLDVPTEDRTAPHTYTGEMFLDRRVELTIEVTRTID